MKAHICHIGYLVFGCLHLAGCNDGLPSVRTAAEATENPEMQRVGKRRGLLCRYPALRRNRQRPRDYQRDSDTIRYRYEFRLLGVRT